MKKTVLRASSALALLMSASPVLAAKMVYTVTGTGTGLLGGGSYTGNFTLTGTGNTTDSNPDPAITAYVLDSFTLSLAGSVTATAIDPVIFFTNKNANMGGFITFNKISNTLRNVLHFLSPTFATFDPAIANPSLSVSLVTSLSPLLRTDQGDFSWVYPLSNGVLEVSAVPEPASWSMMIAGFGLAGAALRRRQKVTVSLVA